MTIQNLETPNLDKMNSVKDQSQAIYEFLEFLREKGYYLGGYPHHSYAYDEIIQQGKDLDDFEINADECWGADSNCPYTGKSWHKSKYNSLMVQRHKALHILLYEFFDIDEEEIIKEQEQVLSIINKMNS